MTFWKPLAFSLAILSLSGGAAMAQPNTLTPAEKAAGWKLLFDGTSTKGWKGFKTDKVAGWQARDGALVLSPLGARDIMTAETFGDFELSFEWRISAKGNSGVMYYVTETGDQTYWSGPEYQVLDNSRGEPPLQRAAALYDLYAPAKDMTKPVGEWNHGRIIAKGGKVEHWLNGEKVAAYDLNSAEFKDKVAKSKFNAWKQFATARNGHIALQNHGNVVAYRSIKIRTLK